MSIDALEAVVAAKKKSALASSHLGLNSQVKASGLFNESVTAATASMPEYAHDRAVEEMAELAQGSWVWR
tara:strand:- start:80 stop:289 length:210 start_codon:yes stop_codon:yes gene_type:complete